MRILLVCEYAPNEVHGIAVHLRNMVAELENLGHEFIVFTSKPARQLKKEGAIKEVFTDKGDIKIILETADGQNEQKSIWSDKDLEPFEKKEEEKGLGKTFY